MAKVLRIKPIGTQAHECFMFQAAIHSPKEANYEVMENWVKTYDGALGTVLTDTYTVDTFLRNFSMKLAKLYDGVRHDSGDPFDFIDKIIDKIPPSRIGRRHYWKALIEYYVDGKRYTSSPRWNESFNIGDCLLIEYSISAPYYYNVLWDRGKQDCGCLE